MAEYRLGDLQLRIMQVLCESSGCTVSDVHAGCGGSRRPTTGSCLLTTVVATMPAEVGKTAVWGRTIAKPQFVYARGRGGRLCTQAWPATARPLFGSLAGQIVHQFSRRRDVSQTELASLEHWIADRKAQRAEGPIFAKVYPLTPSRRRLLVTLAWPGVLASLALDWLPSRLRSPSWLGRVQDGSFGNGRAHRRELLGFRSSFSHLVGMAPSENSGRSQDRRFPALRQTDHLA